MKHPIGQTANGATVYVDLIHSRAAKTIAEQPHLLQSVKEVVLQSKAEGPEVRIEHAMDRTIGYNHVIKTVGEEGILYGQIINDPTYTRFSKHGKPILTRYLTVVLKQCADNSYEVYDLWLGRVRPPRPGSDDATAESDVYWAEHAFVLDSQRLQLRTVTKIRPY